MSRFAIWFALSAAAAILAGCGSGQAIPTVPVPASATTTGPVIGSVQLLVGNNQMPSTGTSTVALTAVVLSTTGQAISGKTVMFSKGTDSTAFFTDLTTTTDSNGLATAKLNLGTDQTNRTITVTATSENIAGTGSVDVVGTAITISGSSSLSLNGTTTLTISVKDSAGKALQKNATVTVTSKNGNTIVLNPTTGITNSSGSITAVLSGSKAGSDVITVSAAGASASQDVTVSGSSFNFNLPTITDIPMSAATPISVNWKDVTGAAVVGGTVNFALTRGSFIGAKSATTDAAGDTTKTGVTINSTSAGPVIISATGVAGTPTGGTPAATYTANFVSTSANSMTVQAIPSVVAVTTGSTSQTTNSATVVATVRDSFNNLVKNANVGFQIVTDSTSGKLSAASAITDVSGSASVTYTAGTTSSGAGASTGVTIKATVLDVGGDSSIAALPITGVITQTTLTVAGQSTVLTLGTDNTVTVNAANTTYSKTWSVLVTDTAGNPKQGATVRFSLRPGRFQKGFYVWNGTLSVWEKAQTSNGYPTLPVTCANEDVNFDTFLDTGEDQNGNNKLDPVGAANVSPSGVTDANGIATAVVTYNPDHATWAEMTLEARTGVVGNDPPSTATFYLPGKATDYTTSNVAPPGATSPYGPGTGTGGTSKNGLFCTTTT